MATGSRSNDIKPELMALVLVRRSPIAGGDVFLYSHKCSGELGGGINDSGMRGATLPTPKSRHYALLIGHADTHIWVQIPRR